LKNGKRDVIEKDHEESIIEGLDFELPTDNQFSELTTEFNFAEISGEGKGLDLSVDVGRNVYLQPHANAIGSTGGMGSLSKLGWGEQVPQNGSGLELIIIPITLLLFFKSLKQASEKRGKSSSRLHARQWREITE